MKAIFEEYGGIIIAVVVVVALITIIAWLLQTNDDGTGVIQSIIGGLVKNFGSRADNMIDRVDGTGDVSTDAVNQ